MLVSLFWGDLAEDFAGGVNDGLTFVHRGNPIEECRLLIICLSPALDGREVVY